MRRAAVVLGVSLALFALVGADVAFDGALARADPRVEAWLDATLPDATRARAGAALSAPGDDLAFAAVVLALAFLLVRARRVREAVVVLGGTAAFAALVEGTKHLVARARPSEALASFAFPSGHAAKAAFALSLAVAFAAAARAAPGRVRAFAAVGAVLVAATGAGRVVGGVHWATDVLAGWALGLASAAGVWLLRGVGAHESRPADDTLRGGNNHEG